MGSKDYKPDRNCEVCGVRVQGKNAVASIVDGRCSACGADLRGWKTPTERGEPEWEAQKGQNEKGAAE